LNGGIGISARGNKTKTEVLKREVKGARKESLYQKKSILLPKGDGRQLQREKKRIEKLVDGKRREKEHQGQRRKGEGRALD